MTRFGRRYSSLLLLCSLLFVAGCQLQYNVRLDGVVLRGNANSPVEGARIIVSNGKTEIASGESNADGRFSLKFGLDEGWFAVGDNDKLWLKTDVDESLTIRIEIDGEEPVMLPFPRVAVSDSAQAYVQVVLDVEGVDVPEKHTESDDDSVEARR